jgi:hypothetical protein
MTERPPEWRSPLPGKPVFDVGMLVVPLLISIPIWAVIGVAFVLAYLRRPLSEVESAALVLAAAAEVILLRHAWRRSGGRYRNLFSQILSRSRGVLAPLRRSALLAGAAGAYLHYYYWDVQLQIAALPSLTVFVATQG